MLYQDAYRSIFMTKVSCRAECGAANVFFLTNHPSNQHPRHDVDVTVISISSALVLFILLYTKERIKTAFLRLLYVQWLL